MTLAKVNAIRGEFVRQCDKLDGLVDGIINNYMACRAIFDMSQGAPNRNPWEAKRCPEQCGSESCGHVECGVPHRWSDLDTQGRLQPLSLCDSACERREDVRHVGSDDGSIRERSDSSRIGSRVRKAQPRMPRCILISESSV